MEGGKLRAAAMVALVALGMVAVQCSAELSDCYSDCFTKCAKKAKKWNVGLLCSATCLACAATDSHKDSNHENNNHGFCKLGCASSRCTNISTLQDIGTEKVESCVGSCSKMCTKNYLAP